MRASWVVKRQSTRIESRLRWSHHARVSCFNLCWIRYPAVQTLARQHSQFYPAMFSQLPCLGV